MPTPLGHSLAGYVINAYTFKTLRIQEFKTLIIFIFAANVPDLDFIPGLLIGKPNLFHHGITHNVGAALIFSGLLSFLLCNKKDKRFYLKVTNFMTSICISLTLAQEANN